MVNRESRRNFIKKSAVTTAGLLGLSKVDVTKAAAAKNKPEVGKKKKIIVEKTEKIYSTPAGRELPYNAFTNMEFWHGKYYVVFRQGEKHTIARGKLILLESTDLENWTETIVLDRPSIDDRDNKLLSTPERLFLYTVPYAPGLLPTEVMYTEDGVSWSAPVDATPPGISRAQFWKPKEHNGMFYCGADYGSSYLLKSTDAISWEVVSTITSLYAPTETSIVFLKDGRLLALVRTNGFSQAVGGFHISSPPYTSWAPTIDDQHHFSGPSAELIGDTIVVCARTQLPDWGLVEDVPGGRGERTALSTFDVTTMSLSFPAMLPTERGGDSSYPGILPTSRNRAVISWHDGQVNISSGGPSDIWLAHIKIV